MRSYPISSLSQKKLEEERLTEAYSLSLVEIKAVKQSRNLEVGTKETVATGLILYSLLKLYFYATQDYLPRDGTTLHRLFPPTALLIKKMPQILSHRPF
jgi:hypothetical protein